MSSQRTKKWKKRVLISLSIVFLCFALTFMFLKRKGFTLVFPNLENINYVNLNIKNDSTHVNVLAELQNKNPYRLNIDTLSCSIEFNDTVIAHETIPLHIRQAPNSKDTVNIPFGISGKQIMQLIKNAGQQDSVYVAAKGYVVYQTFLGSTTLRFDKRSLIEVPVPPKIKLLYIKRKKFDYRNKMLTSNAAFEIINPGKKIDLQLSDIHYELEVKNNLHSKGKLTKNITVKPRSRVQVNLPMKIEVYHPLKTAILIKTDQDRLPYKLDITFFATEHLTKKTYSSPVELHLEGFMELEK
jgi:LEA14-like dessication related protein